MSKEKKSFPKVIAVDFDGTLVENKYPAIGAGNEEVLNYCKNEQKAGARIILWTNRENKDLDDAIAWCSEHGLKFDAVNDNIPEVVEHFGINTRKIFANEYIDDRMCTKFYFSASDDISWAEREVKLACDNERKNDNDEHGAEAGIACYKSAFKAYCSLMDDGHSGFSIQITKNLLNRLINGQCLTPIEDTPDIWDEVKIGNKNGKTCYQCRRMGSLFKDVDTNGNISYSDIDRVQAVDISSPDVYYHNAFTTALVDKIFPIRMPYFPDSHKFRVYREEFLTDKKMADYDTVGIFYIITPSGQKIDIYRYFKETEEHGMVSISKDEYEERKARKIQ